MKNDLLVVLLVGVPGWLLILWIGAEAGIVKMPCMTGVFSWFLPLGISLILTAAPLVILVLISASISRLSSAIRSWRDPWYHIRDWGEP